MRRKYITPLVLGFFTIFIPASADPVEEIITGKDIVLDEDDLGDYFTSFAYDADSEDFMMPSLAEMLGEPVDNFGFITGFEELQVDLVDYAKNYIGCRYRRGAKGPSAFDCSGFTSYVFKNFGYSLSPSSISQGTQGEEVSLDEAQVGDLIFFSGRRVSKTIGHVGMITDVDHETGKIKFIHASIGQGITISTYPDEPYYSKRFISVRHVLSSEELSSN